MKKLSALLVAVALSGTVGIMPAFANDPATPVPADTKQKAPPITATTDTTQKSLPATDMDKQQYINLMKEAYTMMGYASVANIALLYNLTDEAKNNVEKALTIARTLEGQTTQLNADMIKLGKLKYHSASGDSHDYWLPVADDTFVVSTLSAEYLNSSPPKAVEVDAVIITTKVAINTKQMRDALEKASASISVRNYGDAQMALINAQQSVFTEQTIKELPLETVRENLALAKELAKAKYYDGASFALNHSKNALEEYQKISEKEKSEQAAKLHTEISALQEKIAKDKPSVISSIEKHIDKWMHEIEGLAHK